MMATEYPKIILLAICISLLGVVIVWRNHLGNTQQDNYTGYAQNIFNHPEKIPRSDWRLLPGLPVIIWLGHQVGLPWILGGYFIAIGSFLGSFFILRQLISRTWWVLPLLFPPVMLEGWTIIASESVFTFGTLLVLYFLKKKNDNFSWIAGLTIGCLFLVRLTALAFLPVLIWRYWQKPQRLFQAIINALAGIGLLLLFNVITFGDKLGLAAVTVQVDTYREVGRSTLALPQLFADILRAWDWQWYRILASGLVYLGFLIFLLKNMLRKDKLLTIMIMGLLVFIFSIGPTPFLEEFPRFLVPVLPLLMLSLPASIREKTLNTWVQIGLILISLVVIIV